MSVPVQESDQQDEAGDEAKLEWLRAAVQEGIDAIERGEYTTLRSDAEISVFVRSAGSARRKTRSNGKLGGETLAAHAIGDIDNEKRD